MLRSVFSFVIACSLFDGSCIAQPTPLEQRALNTVLDSLQEWQLPDYDPTLQIRVVPTVLPLRAKHFFNEGIARITRLFDFKWPDDTSLVPELIAGVGVDTNTPLYTSGYQPITQDDTCDHCNVLSAYASFRYKGSDHVIIAIELSSLPSYLRLYVYMKYDPDGHYLGHRITGEID